MSFPDPPPPPHQFMPQPYSGGFWPPFGVENEQLDLISQFDHPPPFKRPRSSENPPNFLPFPPNNNPRVNPPHVPGSKGTSHIFYKTRICTRFTEGTCRNGETCSFAHGIEDLREPPPNWQEFIQKDRGGGTNGNSAVDDQRMIRRMKICKKYYNGEECPYGEKCNFLHERRPPSKFEADGPVRRERTAISVGMPNFEADVHGRRESSAIILGPTRFEANLHGQRESSVISIGGSVDFDQPKQVINNMDANHSKMIYWKTKLCSKWEIGQCPYGDRCHYAHGVSDLRTPDTRVEPEPEKKSGPYPANLLSSSVLSSAPTTLAISAPLNNGDDDNKASRWKLAKKINRIYADWLDDGSPPHSSPNKEQI